MNLLDKADADAERNRITRERIEMERDMLRIELLAAMANGEGKLRECRFGMGGTHGEIVLRTVERDLPSMLRDLLDDVKRDETESALMRALVNMLQHSECSEVAAWRLLAAHQYAERAEDFAMMGGGDD